MIRIYGFMALRPWFECVGGSNRKDTGHFKLIMGVACALFVSMLSLSAASSATLPEMMLAGDKQEPIAISSLKGDSEVLVLVFAASTCPITTLYWQRIKGAWYNYRDQGTRMVIVGGNSDDQPDAIRAKLKDLDLDLPVLWDNKHLVAKKLGLEHTPTVVVIGRDWQICYRGRIDDFWRDESRVKRRYLDEAISEALAGRKVTDHADAAFMGSFMR